MKRILLLVIAATTAVGAFFWLFSDNLSSSLYDNKPKQIVERKQYNPTKKGKKKTQDERYAYQEARLMYEFYMQVNPLTGTISSEEKRLEIQQSLQAGVRPTHNRAVPGASSFIQRGPSNFGGRTRSLVFDRADVTGNTILAGAVSGGVFRTTNGGGSWTKVSPTDQQHNVTSIAQDPRAGFTNIWYYCTGEALGNSAGDNGSFYVGHGVWRSIDNGLTWAQLPFPAGANDEFTFDHRFDLLSRVAVHPTTGDVFVAALGRIYRWDISASVWITEQTSAGGFSTGHITDVVITTGGRVYTAFAGVCPATERGIWTSTTATGAAAGAWARIATNGGAPAGWAQGVGGGRSVMALAPSNQNILYVLYDNGLTSLCSAPTVEAHLWRLDQSSGTWTNFSAKLPNEAGCLEGNDPFAIQGGYDLVVSVKPDNANFVVIGGTNAYRINDITTSATFTRIGGYASTANYALYSAGGVTHHPDVHALVFSPAGANVLWSGTDGGIHSTANVTAATVNWTNRNNFYQSYQYYFVNIDPQSGSDIIIGGAQDNGTTAGGLGYGMPDITTMGDVLGGDGAACAISRADACLPFFMTTQNGALYRDCPTFAQIAPNGANSDFVTYFHLDPDNSNTIYYAGADRVYRTNSATTVNTTGWTNMGVLSSIPPGGFTDWVRSYCTTRGAYSAANSYLFIGTDEGKIFRLRDPRGVANLNTAVNITPAGAITTYPSIVSGIAVHPTNPDIVMAVYSNYGIPSIFLTTNARAATPVWTLVERNISALSARSVAIAEVNGEILYFVGTVRGLFSNDDPLNNDWVREGAISLQFSVIPHLVYRPADNILLVGTHGNGMFQASIQATPTPVEMVNFSGKKQEDYALLKWVTASEINSKGFEVQRSLDGVTFETIGFVESLPGAEVLTRYYSFKDYNLLRDLQYYRLKQVDWDEKTELTKVVAIQTNEEETVHLDFEVYPNPIYNNFKIHLSRNPTHDIIVELFDITGKSLKNWTFDSPNKLVAVDISELQIPSGNYLLRVSEGKLLIKTLQVVKN